MLEYIKNEIDGFHKRLGECKLENEKEENEFIIVAYFVNLPNAFVTYMLKYEQFPKMTMFSTISSIITLWIIVVVFIMPMRTNKKER